MRHEPAALVDQAPLGGREPAPTVGDRAGGGEGGARGRRPDVVQVQVGGGVALTLVEDGVHRAAHHGVEQGRGDPAVHRAHGVGHVVARHEHRFDVARFDPGEGEPEQPGDARGREVAALHARTRSSPVAAALLTGQGRRTPRAVT